MNPVLSVTILACWAFLLCVMMVWGAWIQLFTQDLIININMFKVCPVLPFLIGGGTPSFHLIILKKCKEVKFQVHRVLSIHLTATQKDLEKYVQQWLIYHPCNIITANIAFIQSCSSFKGSVIRTAVAQVQQANMWDYVALRVLKSAECYIHFTWSRKTPQLNNGSFYFLCFILCQFPLKWRAMIADFESKFLYVTVDVQKSLVLLKL